MKPALLTHLVLVDVSVAQDLALAAPEPQLGVVWVVNGNEQSSTHSHCWFSGFLLNLAQCGL